MKRIALTDGTGRWFDRDKAEKYSEKTWWDGNNLISYATRKKFAHEAIYVTASGVYVLVEYSQFAGTEDFYTIIDKETAAEWFAKQAFKPL